jgi:serine/threonine protein kinase
MSTPPSSVLERIDQVCDRFEAVWLVGQRPRIDDYLRDVPEAERSGLLNELLRLERVYLQDDQRRRWQRGERVSVRAYLEEAPSLRDYPDLVFELVCGEVLLRKELGEKPRPVDYLDLVPSHQAQLRRFFAARYLLPPATLQGISDQLTLRTAKQATVIEAGHTVDELPPLASVPAPASPAPERPTTLGEAVLVPPGYEVLGELGHGGMGIVYKARQRKADRLVALKMILAGEHADPDELARFRTEAEAIARLQHPHVIQVFEVSEHNGLPFFSLEFCLGGSLDKKLAGTPLPPQEAATLMEKLAEGVQAAHEARVLHRDLKPANVLLAADGTPKVTDFGLAKKLDAQGVTLPGVVVGTPSYMAPEQASGAAQEVGPAADVYALGAILYECLTGRPPFRAATVLDTLRQVVSEEPVPPRQLNTQVPRDLETVCLKCLQKEAAKRYVSAAELADELGRFVRGEPILARPVGRLERGVKWARREPRVAGLLAMVLGVFAGGATISTVLAVRESEARAQADLDADKARQSEEKAKKSESAAVSARKDVEQFNERLVTSVARSLARGVGRSLSPLSDVEQALEKLSSSPLSDMEREALGKLSSWKLSSSPEGKLRAERFMQEGLLMKEALQPRRLINRGSFALPAVVGPDVRLSDFESLCRTLRMRLRAPEMTREQRLDVALVAVEFNLQDSALAQDIFLSLIDAMTETTDVERFPLLTQSLKAAAARMGPKEAGEVAATLSWAMYEATRSQAMDKATGGQVLLLAEGLSALAFRLGPKEAGEAATTLCHAMTETTDVERFPLLAQSLKAVAARLGPKEAGEVAATLAQAMTKATDWQVLKLLAEGLSVVVARMGPKEAGEVAVTLSQAMTKTMKLFTSQPQTLSGLQALSALQSLVEALSAVAARMGPKEAGEVAAILSQAMAKTMNLFTPQPQTSSRP